MTTCLGKPKPLFNPEPDSVEKALLLIDKSTRAKPFETETIELENGLKLIEKILDGIRIIERTHGYNNFYST